MVTVLPLTRRKPGRRLYPNEALLPGGVAGLQHDSIVMAHQMRTISKLRLADCLGRLHAGDQRDSVRAAMRTQLDLD